MKIGCNGIFIVIRVIILTKCKGFRTGTVDGLL